MNFSHPIREPRIFAFALILFILLAFKMEKPAYRIFDQKGEATDYDTMLAQLKEADVILFGELHNNPICHWLQLELTQDLWNTKRQNLALGAEMFEADNQVILNEYLAGLITEKHLTNEAKVWNNYETDYKPLVDFAQKNNLPFVATNVPRRYASLVSKQGLEALENLSEKAQTWIAPLPIEVDLEMPAYAKMLEMMGGAHGSAMGGMQPENFAKAQAIKDATMAHFILENWDAGKTLLHFNGSYHSDNFESIVWYLQRSKPDLKIMTITSVEQAEVEELAAEHQDKANFVIAIPSSMTKTY